MSLTDCLSLSLSVCVSLSWYYLGKVAAPLSKLKKIILISGEPTPVSQCPSHSLSLSRSNIVNFDKLLLGEREVGELTTNLSKLEQTKYWQHNQQLQQEYKSGGDKWWRAASWSWSASHHNISFSRGRNQRDDIFSSIIFNNLTTSCPDLASETY